MLSVSIEKTISNFSLKADLSIDNEVLGIIGFSGSGKSLTLQCIAGALTPEKGKIIINNKTVFDSEQKINIKPEKRKIGYVFQHFALFPHLNVSENIAFGLFNLSKLDSASKTQEMLSLINMENFAKHYPNQLSGGQKQRVAIARALATSPDILLLDEPFSALDAMVKETLESEVIRLLEIYKIPTLFVTHNIAEAYKLAKKMAIFDFGKIVQQDHKENIIHSPLTPNAAFLTGTTNIFSGIIEEINIDSYKIKLDDIPLSLWTRKNNVEVFLGEAAIVGFRPDDLVISAEKFHTKGNCFNAKIVNIIEELHYKRLHLSFGNKIINTIINKNDGGNLYINQYLSINLPIEKIKIFKK